MKCFNIKVNYFWENLQLVFYSNNPPIPNVLQIKTQNVKEAITKCTSMYLAGCTTKCLNL